MRRSLWATFVISLTLTSCYEPLGESVLVMNRAELKGVCQDASSVEVRLLKNGDFKYRALEGGPQAYEASETLCDGVDNDCDGVVDEVPNAPFAMKQDGVCVGSTQRCDGDGGWLEPDYTQVEGYGEEQCDGVDNDCDGSTDETLSDAPLADLQEGVCAESVKACVEGAWVEPEYERISMFSTNDSPCDQLDNDCDGRLNEGTADPELCDGVDNDCDGSTDEEWDPEAAPLSDVQIGVCEGVKRVCEPGAGWVEPMYSDLSGYGEERCDGLDNDCDGEVDEEIEEPPLADLQEGICAESVKVCEGGSWVEPEYVGLTSLDYMDGDGLDNDCDGEIDELAPPPCFSSPNGCPELDFVTIEAGSFEMGSTSSSDEQPIHTVTVPSFELTRTEVTVGQYRTCVDADWCSVPGTGSGCNWAQRGREDHPINCVDWGQARTFAKWLGDDVDLPTEAQWEYGARGGESYTYSGSDDPIEVAWYASNSGGSTKVVATKQANGFGLHDMSGNVWEWVLDEYHSSYSGAPNHASEAWGSLPGCSQVCDMNSAGRVRRGGSWNDSADRLRVASRLNLSPVSRYNRLGFRLRRTRSLGPIGSLNP